MAVAVTVMAGASPLLLLRLVIWIVLTTSPHVLAAAVVEDRGHWYSQAREHLEEILAARRSSQGHARNVILFVGDGMGISTVTAARILRGQQKGGNGEEHRFVFDKFPHVALAKTYTLDSQIGDSSACATALMCGVKANINTVGLDHRGQFEDCHSAYKARVTSLMDWAQKQGKSTGIVTNTRLTHGTPSALYGHSPSRYWEDDSKVPPLNRAICKDLARQLVEDDPGKNINVLLGGGRRHWFPASELDREETDQPGRRTDGRNLLDQWVQDKKARGLHAEYVWNTAQFDSVDPRFTDYLLGIFGYTHLDFEVDRNKGPSGDPSLADMTIKAIQILLKNPKGFFLVVEGGRIDHAHHHNNARRALEEVAALEAAIAAAMELTSTKDTLVVLTADHGHALTIGGNNTPRGNPILGMDVENSDVDNKPYTTVLYANGPGFSVTENMGRHDITGYHTQDMNYVQQAAVPKKYASHSGEDVPVYATGPGSHLFSGTVEQTYIAHAIAYAACIAPEDNSHCEKPPSDDACAAAAAAAAAAVPPQDPMLAPTSRRPLGQATTAHQEPPVDPKSSRDRLAWGIGGAERLAMPYFTCVVLFLLIAALRVIYTL